MSVSVLAHSRSVRAVAAEGWLRRASFRLDHAAAFRKRLRAKARGEGGT